MALKLNEAPCPRYAKTHSHILHGDKEICNIDGLELSKEEKARGPKGTGDDFLFVLLLVLLLTALVVPAIKSFL